MLLTLFLSSILSTVSSLNVLIYTTSVGHSHLNYHGKLADILVKAGHNVTIVVNEWNPIFKMVPTKAEVITLPASDQAVAIQKKGEEGTLVGFWVVDYDDVWGAVQVFEEISNMADTQCRYALDNTTILDTLQGEHYDVALAEPWDMCGFGMFHLLGIDKYAMTMTNILSENVARTVGVPVMPSWVPGVEMGAGDDMSMMERFRNIQAAYVSNLVLDRQIQQQQRMFDAKYGDFPDLKELLANSSYVFTNSDPLLDFPRPTLHKVIDLGGITVPPKSTSLSVEWEAILSRRPRTIIVSFGTIAKAFAMPDSYKAGLLKAFSLLEDVTFIWKYEKPEDQIAESVHNVVLTKWMPQTDLLSDDRVVAFISHCGAGSINEAAARGVPILAIPLFHDQMRNARTAERAGFALRLHKEKLADADALVEAITEILENEKYKIRADEVVKMLEDRPFQPKEVFVRSVEFMAEHGPLTMLDPHGRRLGWLTYYNLDLLFVGACIVLLGFITLAICLCALCVWRTRRKTRYRRCQDDDYFLHA